MTESKKYRLLSLGVVALFALLIFTEIADRCQETVSLYDRYRDIQSKVLTPDELSTKKNELLARKKVLARFINSDATIYAQNSTGIFEFLTESVKRNNLRSESLVPVKDEATEEIIVVGFKLKCTGVFHDVGRLVNALETGPFSMQISKTKLVSDVRSKGNIHSEIEGKAMIFSDHYRPSANE